MLYKYIIGAGRTTIQYTESHYELTFTIFFGHYDNVCTHKHHVS